MTTTQTRTDGLHTCAARKPRITMTVKTRPWTDAELDTLSRALFGDRPDEPRE